MGMEINYVFSNDECSFYNFSGSVDFICSAIFNNSFCSRRRYSLMSTYEKLLAVKASNERQLTAAEKEFMDTREALEGMAKFRPDWYPKKHKAKMIAAMEEKLKSRF